MKCVDTVWMKLLQFQRLKTTKVVCFYPPDLNTDMDTPDIGDRG